MSQGKRAGANGEPLLAEARRAAILEILRTTGSISVVEAQNQLGISAMTARRDLNELSRRGLLRRTHGGAVAPSISVHEDSFDQRLAADTDAKRLLATAAVGLIDPGGSIFLDSSTTSYFLARDIVDRRIPLTVVTNSLPIMQLMGAQPDGNIDVIGAGGMLRPLTQSFVGPEAVRTIDAHFTDRAFISVKAVTKDGTMTDPDALEAEVKRAMIAHANDVVLLIDRSKLFERGLNAVEPTSKVSLVLAYGMRPAELEQIRALGVKVHAVGDGHRSPVPLRAAEPSAD